MHIHSADKRGNALNIAIIVNMLLTVVQIIAGLLSGSLSLIADAIHNLSDAISLVIARIAVFIGKKPADEQKSYGYKRAETIAALINFVTLVCIGVFLCIEAINRFMEPQPILGGIMMIVAIIAIIIDVATAVLVYFSGKDSMNMKAVMLHNLADAASSVAVLVSGLLIHLYGWVWIDAALTFFIAGYVIYHGMHGLPEAVHLLMDGTPNHVVIQDVTKAIEDIEGVADAHALHVRQIDEWQSALEAHIVLKDLKDMEKVKIDIKTMLAAEFKITHSTLEFEDQHCQDPFVKNYDH
ncbi:MAG: cation transporter [Micavibrio sp.]|nr:cation transporter [Micavibrio sp.]